MAVAVVTGLVVAFIAASTVFHVSASGSGAVQYVTSKRCVDDTGIVVERAARGYFARALPDVLGGVLPQLTESANRHGLHVVRRTRYGFPLPLTAGGREVEGRLVARDGAFEHVRPVAGGGTDGAWIPTELAETFGIGVGDELELAIESGPRRLPVTAVYPTIVDPVDDFWCSQRGEIIKLLAVPENQIRPPAILVAPDVMDGLAGAGLQIQLDRLQVTGGGRPADRESAERLASAVGAFRADVAAMDLSGHGHNQFGVPISTAVNVADRAAFPAASGERAQRAVGGSLLPLSGVSLLVGLAAVVGLAGQWMQRRFSEVRLLWTRGASPASLGVKAVLELGLPLAAGAALGWLVARLGVPLFAPAAELDGWAPWLAGVAAGTAWLACLAVLAAAVTRRVRRRFQAAVGSGRAGRALRWVPWELVVAGLAVLSWRRLAGGALVVSRSDLLPRVDVLALMFPLLCLAALTGVASRLAGLALRLAHRARGWRWPAALWAARRAAAQHRLTVALVAIIGLAVGVVAVGVGISNTERQAVREKGQLFVGSDTAIRLVASVADDVGVPAALRGSATRVAVRDTDLGGDTWRVLVVDPATAADAMPWRPQWAGSQWAGSRWAGPGQNGGPSLAELVSRLGPVGADGTAPALLVGSIDPANFRSDGLPPMRVVGAVDTFPAREHADAMLVISWDALAAGDRRGFTRYVLSRGSPSELVGAMERAGEPTGWMYTAAGANDALPFLVVAWTFDFFVTLGAVLAAVAAAALLVAIEARRRATAVAHAMLARMGLRLRSLYASYLAELTALAAVATAVGLFGGWFVLAVAGDDLDPAPWLSPTPVAASLLPLGLLVGSVAAVAVLLVAAVAVRAALRAPVRELLRDTA